MRNEYERKLDASAEVELICYVPACEKYFVSLSLRRPQPVLQIKNF